ncbi:MAG: DUF2802 domain-containing protein [Gammaproteobacteria bacterium]|nr:DUF2802 domain-containing protein [Gammaproteobacteria bacterium]
MLAIACYSFARFDKRCEQIEKFWASPTGTSISDNSDSDASEQMRITQRLEKMVSELQRSIKVMEINKSTPSPVAAVERNMPIENAVRMARLGASVEELTKSCGLNIGEAHLMRKLHGQAQSQSTSTN